MSKEDNERLKRDTQHVPQNAEEKVRGKARHSACAAERGGKSAREGAKSGVGRHERMNPEEGRKS
jgi:hypothetical protein